MTVEDDSGQEARALPGKMSRAPSPALMFGWCHAGGLTPATFGESRARGSVSSRPKRAIGLLNAGMLTRYVAICDLQALLELANGSVQGLKWGFPHLIGAVELLHHHSLSE